MRFGALVFVSVLAAMPAVASAQYSGLRSPSDMAVGSSVLRSAAYGRNTVIVPDGPCGHGMPVYADDYSNCCRPCGLRPICFLKRVGRMLDCLLPCNKCCGGGCAIGDCHGAGWFRPHCPKNCGYCGGGHLGLGYAGGGCPTCTSGVPEFGDPFLDDPVPPMPMPDSLPQPSRAEPGTDVRRAPAAQSHSAIAAAPRVNSGRSPWKKISGPQVVRRPTATAAQTSRPVSITVERPQPMPQVQPRTKPARDKVAKPAEKSVLRRTSLEEEVAPEPAPFSVDATVAQPMPLVELGAPRTAASPPPLPELLAVPPKLTVTLPAANGDYWSQSSVEIPRNPLR
jgi:hypothetical protein